MGYDDEPFLLFLRCKATIFLGSFGLTYQLTKGFFVFVVEFISTGCYYFQLTTYTRREVTSMFKLAMDVTMGTEPELRCTIMGRVVGEEGDI